MTNKLTTASEPDWDMTCLDRHSLLGFSYQESVFHWLCVYDPDLHLYSVSDCVLVFCSIRCSGFMLTDCVCWCSVPVGAEGVYGEAAAGFDGMPFFKPAPVFSPTGTVYFPQTSVPDESLRKFVMQQM